MENSFLAYYRGTFLSPATTFRELSEDSRKLRLSFYAVLITAILYTFVYVFLIFGGGQPFKPWLDIPLDVYYRYNLLFCAPSMFLGWILASGLIHLLARTFTGHGSFEDIATAFGFGLSIASWTTGLHDVLTSFLGATGVISQRAYEIALNSNTIWRAILWVQMAAYLFAFIYLFSIGVRVVYHCNRWISLLLGLMGFLAYQGFFLIFNR